MTISSFRAARAVALPLLAATALAVAACGGSDSSSSTASSGATKSTSSSSSGGGYGSQAKPAAKPASSSAAGTVALTADEGNGLSFDKKAISAKAGNVTLKLTNPSGNSAQHAIAVEGNGVDKDGQIAQPGGTSQVSLDLKPGKYTFYCPVPGHRAAGMQGTLTVS